LPIFIVTLPSGHVAAPQPQRQRARQIDVKTGHSRFASWLEA
jgi:hypothetical protein